MELIIPFKEGDFDPKGTNIKSGRSIIDTQQEWEELFYNKFNPMYANVIEAHPDVIKRLTGYYKIDDTPGSNINDDDDNEIYSSYEPVYAISSLILTDSENEGEPIFLIKNESLDREILMLKHYPEDEESLNLNDASEKEFLEGQCI